MERQHIFLGRAGAGRSQLGGGSYPLRPGDGATPGGLLLAGITLVGVVGGSVVAFAGLEALYLTAALIACAFVLVDFRIGVVLLILLMPISKSYVFPHAMFGITGLNPLNLILVGTLGAYLFDALARGGLRRFLPGPLLWLYVVPIAAAGALGSFHVGEINPGFYASNTLDFRDLSGYLAEMLFKPMTIVVFALLVAAAVSRSARPERFLVPTLVSVWIMGLIVIVFVLRSGVALNDLASSGSREFLSALGLHANDMGRMYAVALALLLFTLAQAQGAGLRLVLVATMGMVLAALLLTFSRGAFVGVIVIGVLYVLWHRNVKTVLVAGLVVICALFLLPEAVYDRVATGFPEGLNAITAGRLDGLWLPLLPEVMKSPIYGSGLGSILWSQPMRAGAGITVLAATHPHSAYLEAALDMGIAGLLLMCAYFTHVWIGLRRLGDDRALSPTLRGFFRGAVAGLTGLLIADLFDSSLAPRPEQVFLWLAIGMMYGLRSK